MIARLTQAASLALALACVAATVARAEPAARVDPKAREVLDNLAAFYKGLNTASCAYTLDLVQEKDGKKDSVALDAAVVLEKPNKVSFVQTKSERGVDVVSDGKDVTVAIPSLHKYVKRPAPNTIADALEWGALNGLTEFNSIFGELMGTDPAGAVLDGVSDATYVGEDDIGGTKHHRVRLVQEDMDVDLWIASGEKPYLARMAPDVSKTVAGADIKFTLDLRFTNWSSGPDAPPEQFVFHAREGSAQASSFQEIFGGGEKPAAAALIGKPAPPFSLKAPDGTPIDLQSSLGKNVVVLDFWATWCPPCVKSLPILADVTASYMDKGVVFIAVNLGEGPDEVNGFLKEHRLAITVALDSERSAGERYLVDGIPQSVLIGKSGNVEAVHVGASPVLRPELKAQLSALVAGQSLAAHNE